MAVEESTAGQKIQRCWDYELSWTFEHRTAVEKSPLRYILDSLAVYCLGPSLDELTQSNSELWKTDLLASLQEYLPCLTRLRVLASVAFALGYDRRRITSMPNTSTRSLI